MDAGQPDAGMIVCPSTLTGWQRLTMDRCGRVVIAFTEAEAQASDQAIQVYRYFD